MSQEKEKEVEISEDGKKWADDYIKKIEAGEVSKEALQCFMSDCPNIDLCKYILSNVNLPENFQ